MGLLVDGKWQDKWYETKDGKFDRKASAFRDSIGKGEFEAEAGRYHLYVSLACPWAHRTLIMRSLKGLEDMISLSVVNWKMLEHGWTFEDGPGVVKDPIFDAKYLHEVYTAVRPDYTGRVTVPVLYDKKTGKIVNNESSEIIRMFNSQFDHLGAKEGDYYPEELRKEIDEVNDFVYPNINNGVYKAGFATKQEVYDAEVKAVFKALDELEERLSGQDFLVGESVTEADIRLFTTLVRFDPVYHGHFKCNVRQIADYKNISAYLKRIYNFKGIADTVNFQHIKGHYYESHTMINPTGIVPFGPEIDLSL